MDGGVEKVTDPSTLAQLRRQARDVYLKSIALSVVLTLACYLLPA